MKDFSSWLDSAAEESLKAAIRSAMDITASIRKDLDDKEDVDHDKVDVLHHCWEIIHEIQHVSAGMTKDANGHTNGRINGSIPGNYKTV